MFPTGIMQSSVRRNSRCVNFLKSGNGVEDAEVAPWTPRRKSNRKSGNQIGALHLFEPAPNSCSSIFGGLCRSQIIRGGVCRAATDPSPNKMSGDRSCTFQRVATAPARALLLAVRGAPLLLVNDIVPHFRAFSLKPVPVRLFLGSDLNLFVPNMN